MLRVEIHDAVNTLLMRVEGRFVGAFAQDARTVMARLKIPFRLAVDLSEVTFVDSMGEEVLSWFAIIGAKFVANSSYSLDVCERLHLPLVKKGASSKASHHEVRRSV